MSKKKPQQADAISTRIAVWASGAFCSSSNSRFQLTNIGYPQYQHADFHAAAIDPGFFGLTSPRQFQYISAPKSQMFFITYNGTPKPPDNDD